MELTFYMDETGNRLPDKKPDKGRENRDWFAFGGYILAREDQDAARAQWQLMVDKWHIGHPFHISDMLNERKKWSWLGRMTEGQNSGQTTEDSFRPFLRWAKPASLTAPAMLRAVISRSTAPTGGFYAALASTSLLSALLNTRVTSGGA